MIEKLLGTEIIDIACGGSHSAAISAAGELYTWGKGRYGRLGESLMGSHVIINTELPICNWVDDPLAIYS